MLEPFSQIEIAFRDTLITKAEGVYLDRLGAMYGFPRLGVFDRKYYRRALREVVFGRRGTYRTLFRVLENLFDQYSERRSVYNVTLDPANPHALIYREGTLPPFDCGNTGRFVRVVSPTFGSRVYYSQHLANGVLHLNPIETPGVAGADWSTLASTENATAKFIGFMMREIHPGPAAVDGNDEHGSPWHPDGYLEDNTCTIDLIVDKDIWDVPATYLQEDGTKDRLVEAPNQPFGGHLMSLYDAANRSVVDYPGSNPAVADEIHVEGGDQSVGPYPIYLQAEGQVAAAFVHIIDSLLAAGVHIRADILKWCHGKSTLPVQNNFDADFDLGNGPQRLPSGWNFNAHGRPPRLRASQIEMDAYVDEYFVFHDGSNTGAYAPDVANLAIGPTGQVILDSDVLYTLQPSLQITPANGYPVTVSRQGVFLNSSGISFGVQTQLATFTTPTSLTDVAGQVVKTETVGSGSPTLQVPEAGESTGIIPRELDFFGEGIAGHFKLTSGGSDSYWAKDVQVVLDDNRKLATTTGYVIAPGLIVSAGVTSVRITSTGEVFEDTGQGETSLGQIQVGLFPNPKGLLSVANVTGVYEEADASNQAIEHRRSGSPTVGTLPTTAPRGRLTANGNLGGRVLLNGTSNRLKLAREWA
jgi:hypothetical protein